MNFEPMDLANVGDGALQTEFDEGLERVLADLDDPRKPGTADRTLTLKITFKPSKDDNRLDVYVASSLRLPSRRAVRALAVRDGDAVLQYRNTQQELPLEKVIQLPLSENPQNEGGA